MTTEATLLTIIKDGRILLQRKASGRFGEGKWNGVGGKIRPGETPENCARRETLEETGLQVDALIPHGTLRHYFGDVDEATWTVHHYSASQYEGEPKESEEAQGRGDDESGAEVIGEAMARSKREHEQDAESTIDTIDFDFSSIELGPDGSVVDKE